jgi:signal transduction histidine kinase
LKVRNLKFRIKRVIILSILFSVLCFSLIISITSLKSERNQAYLLASMISNMAAKEIFSAEVLEATAMESFHNLQTQPYYTQMLVKRISDFENKTLRALTDPNNVGISYTTMPGLDISKYIDESKFSDHDFTQGNFKMGEIIQVKVTIEGQEVYKSPYWGNSIYLSNFRGKSIYPFVRALSDIFKVEAVYHVPNSTDNSVPGVEGTPFATVSIRMDPGFLVSQYNTVIFGILFSAISAFLIAVIIAQFLSRSISKPLSMLVDRLKSLAMEDYETTLHSQIVVKKRALSEIRSIANSTNTIISKMHQFNQLQLNQTRLLEKQRNDLETRKEELLESRHMIQDAQTQLVQSQNLASIGQLTAAISHEINHPLGNIKHGVEKQNDSIELLLNHERIQNNSELKDLVNQLKEAGNLNMTAFERISSIIQSLENFSRLEQTEMEPTCINQTVRSVVLLTSNLWKRRIVMHEEYGDLPDLNCYPGLINQVFMNIVVNAIHAIPDKGDIYIKTRADADFILVSIRDTGTGIDESIMPFIFETGFTTKSSGKGSGLGLSICRDIVDKHEGKIEVTSKVGEGTEFTIILPIKQAA